MEILFLGPDPDVQLMGSGQDRPAGVHLSDILVRMAWEVDRKYHPKAAKNLQVFEQGFIWESVLETTLASRYGRRGGSRPDPFQEEGIWMSPDWISESAPGVLLHEEWKATKKSSKSLDQKIEEWLPQGRAYLRGLLRRRLVTAPITRWRVWCLNGDYSYEAKSDRQNLFQDVYRVDVRFDRRELEEEWSKIKAAGIRYGLLKETQTHASDQRGRTRTRSARGVSR